MSLRAGPYPLVLLALLTGACGDKEGDSADACGGDECLAALSENSDLTETCETICSLGEESYFEYSQVEYDEVVLSCTYFAEDCGFCEAFLACNPEDPEDTGDGGEHHEGR